MALAWLQGGKALAQAQGETLIAAQLNNSGFTSATSYSRGGDMTVEGWVYPTSAGGPWTRFVELSTTTASLVNALNFITSFGDTGRPFMEIWVGSSQSTLVAPNALPLNTWSHVAYTIEGTTYRIYVNGGLVATGTGSAPSAVSRTLTIGRFRTGGSAIDGRVADIRIWSVARTAAQIDASKAWGSITGPTTGLVACWALGQTGGDVLADSAGNMPLTEVGTVQYLKLLSGTNVTTAANTHAGTFTIQAGTYQVGNGGASGTLGTGNVVNNATLAFNRSDAITPANAISGTGKIVQNGSGSLTLSGSKTFTGGIDVNSGVLRLGGPLSSVAGNTFTVGPSGTLSFSVGNVLGYATAAPANSIVVQGGGVVRNEGANQFNVLPSLTLNGGSLQATGTEAGYSYALRGGVTVNGGSNTATMSAQGMGLGATTVSGATFNVADGSADIDLLVSGTLIDGPSASWPTPQASFLTKTGAGSMVLSGANTYSGTTTISGGTLQVGNGGTTGTLGTGNIVNNGSLAFHRSDNVTVSGVISGTGSLTQQGASTLTLAANNTYAGSTTISAGTLQVGNGGTTGTVGSGAIVNNGALILNRSDALVVSGAVTGSGSLTKSGAGTATLASGYSATGGVSIEAGTLFLSGATPFSASQVRVGGGAALDVSARPAGLALGAGQALANTAGTALVIGSLEASNGTLNLTFGLGTPAISVSNGMLALASTTTLRITNSGAPLPRGNYRIISKRDGGAVVGTVPSTVVEGGGIVSGGVASLTITGGELILTVKAFSSLATTTEPPETVFHQGFLVDAAGQPLGSPNPRNYDLAFRIYAAANGGTVLWGERQVVTVDAGRFAIHLGAGDPNAGDPLPSLPSLFAGAATGLYLETTIKGGGTGGDDLVLMPRSLIPPTPYAFLARHALGAVNLVNSSNQPVLAVVGSRVGIQQPAPNSTLDVRGSLRSTNLLGSGPATIGGTVIASEFRGRGIVPVGGIVAWSGANPPAGWALCDGRVVNGRRTPDLRGRFILGAGNASGLTPRAAGDIGGAETVTLATAHLPSHTHVLDIPPIDSAGGGGHNHVFQSGAGSSEGLGKDPRTAPWFGTGAFIMRRRTEWAGGHGHSVDLPGFTTARAGSSQPHNNLPPFYAMAFVMRVE